jgi:type I restriction enzyme S subunit
MSFPRYPAYKDSGVAWLGEVPAHWSLPKLKQFATFSGGGTPSRENQAYWSGDIPWVSPKDMKTERLTGAEESITATGLANSTASLVPPNRLLMVVRSGILKHTIPVAINQLEVALNQDMKALDFADEGLTSSFFLRWVQGLNDLLLLEWAKQGATVESIEHEYLANTVVPLPTAEERATITSFLDRETAKIDALVAEQEQLITLLKEKRQAVISHAVTKGLDASVPSKASGVEWLGEVPAHWDVSALSYLSFIETGSTPDRGDPRYWNGMIPWLKTGEINWAPIREAEEFITEEGLANSAAKLSKPGTLLMAMYGQGVTRGRVALLEIEAAYNQACAAIAFGPRILPEFGRYFFMAAYDHIREGGNETSQMNLSAGLIAKFRLTVPPTGEQARIVRWLDSELSQLEVLGGEADKAISLLQERRSALISAAVTGQIDVRHLAPQEAA